MEEKEKDITPRPGLPEALDPNLGNGASWVSGPHDFILRAVDPIINLDSQLMKEATRQMIIDRWNGIGTPNTPDVSHSPQTNEPSPNQDDSYPANLDVKEKQALKKNKSSQDESDKKHPISTTRSEKNPSPSVPEPIEPDESIIQAPSKKVVKVGKRVRKVIKSVQEDHIDDIPSESGEIGSSSTEVNLSPFTQWLKNLRGSEYVHPYEADYGLDQMSAATRGGVSETFADLLASQGHREQAVEMYLKLMEKYPEKSSFFAAKIEALK